MISDGSDEGKVIPWLTAGEVRPAPACRLGRGHRILVTHMPHPGTARPDYGLDAPGVVRNLLLVAAAGLVLALAVASRLIPPVLAWHPRPGFDLEVGLVGLGLGPGLGCAAAAAAMIWSSRVGKVRGRERLLDFLPWSGGESVLDVGCGRGLMLIGAAKRLEGGHAVGIDLWRSEDLSSNTAAATLENARLEGVETWVRVETADMRELPFQDQTFDRVVSSAAIHNVPDAVGRGRAIGEIVRVLKPGGYVLIDDIRHLGAYREAFHAAGYGSVRLVSHRLYSLVWTLITFGSLRPGTLVAQAPPRSPTVSY